MNRRRAKFLLTVWERRIVNRKRRLAAAPKGSVRAARRRERLTVALVNANNLRAWLDKHPPMRLRALAEAQRLVGVHEQGGNNRGPDVNPIIRENGGSIGEAWCGDFVAKCYRVAGSKLVDRRWAMAWVFLTFNIVGVREVALADALPGDVVEYEWQHTGILESHAVGGIVAIEGNAHAHTAQSDSTGGGDGVVRMPRPASAVKAVYRVTR